MRNFVIAVLLAMFCFTALSFGQAQDSILVGAVTDSSGSAVPNATVTATNMDTGVKYTSATSAIGEYRLNNIPVGRYDVSATAKGFATTTVANVELQLNHTASVNLTLPVGTVSTTVDVTEAAATIDTSTAQLQSAFDSRSAVDVPTAAFAKTLGGTGIYNLSLLGAGVASSGGVGQGTGPSIAGQRPENNSFNIDGVMNDAHYSTGPQIVVSNDAIQQFNLVQNQFSAEFGGASGGVFNTIMKTGTNQIHGSLYEYMQNRDLNAVDQTEVQQGIYSNPRLDNNRFGGTIGGHIIKDKLFYFGNIEYNPVGQAAQPAQAVYGPTAAGISLLNGMSGLSKTNLGIFEKYVPVAPTADPTNPISVNGVNIPNGPLSFASPNYYNTLNIATSVDWNISTKDQIRGRYFYNRQRGIDTNAELPVFYEPDPTTNNSISLSEFHNFSATMENELRVSYLRNNNNITAGNFSFPGLDQFPNLTIDELDGLQIGPDPNTPSGAIENDAQLQDNVTKTWGQHTFKAGVNITDIILAGYFIQRARGDYEYSTLQQYLTDLTPDVLGERSAGEPPTPFGFIESSAYFQDDWRVKHNLTLNLGLRYEYVTVPVGSRYQANDAIASVPGVVTFAEPKAGKNDWSPRLGFAYSPGNSGVWSIRGGVSRAFSNTYINLNQNASPAYFQTTEDVDLTSNAPNFLAGGGLKPVTPNLGSAADARADTASYTFDQTRPYAITGTLGVQRLLAKDYTLEARYVYTKGVHLWNQTRMNIIAPVTPTNYLPTYMSMPSAATLAGLKTNLGELENIPNNTWAQYGFDSDVVGYHPWANSRYNGLALQVNKRYSKNFQYILAYTWSHNFDDATATNFSTILSPRRAQDFQNLRAEWASSALDRRQRLTLTPIYDFRPFQSSNNWAMKNVVGNWSISGTYTFQSPEFATVQDGVDANLNGDSAGDRAIINPSGSAGIGSGVTAYNAAGQVVGADDPSIVAYVAKNPSARYIQAQYGALSNGGRNTMPLDHTNNFDAALMKRLALNERIGFSIGIQLFNVFNHSQFVGGYLSDVSVFQTNAVSRSFLEPSSPFFGQYQGYFPSNSRTAQLAAHLTF
jgi:hypothetical protein